MRVWTCESVEGWREIIINGNYKEAMSYVECINSSYIPLSQVHPTHIPMLPVPLPDPSAWMCMCIYNV